MCVSIYFSQKRALTINTVKLCLQMHSYMMANQILINGKFFRTAVTRIETVKTENVRPNQVLRPSVKIVKLKKAQVALVVAHKFTLKIKIAMENAQIWQCIYCGIFGTGQDNLLLHTVNYHILTGEHRCRCNATISTPRQLMDHIRDQHLTSYFLCTLCNIVTNNADDANAHNASCHPAQ